jgi:hypothetical protein
MIATADELADLAEEALGRTMWNDLENVVDRTDEQVHPTILVLQDNEIRAWTPEWPRGLEKYEIQYETAVHDETIRELASHGLVVLPKRDRRAASKESLNKWIVAPSGVVPREVVCFE